MILQRKSFVPNQKEKQMDTDDEIIWRRMLHGLGAEIGEIMCSQDRSGGNSLRRSCYIFLIQAKE